MNLIYHGRSPAKSGWDDSINGRIQGEPFTVYYMDVPEPDDAKMYRAHAIEKLPGTLVRTEEVYVTGGLTAHLGAAIKFQTSKSQVGAVFIIDHDRVPQELHRIYYDADWADEHPGIYARIDSIDDFEVRHPETERLIGAGYHSSENGAPIVNKWEKRVRQRMDDFHYEDEAEVVTFADQIDFSNAVVGTATYAHTSRAVGGSVQGALNEYDAFKMGYGSRNAEDITKMDDVEMATALRNLVARKEGRDSLLGNGHRVVLYDNDEQRIRDGVTSIEPEAFILATDGQTVWRDPDEVPLYTSVTSDSQGGSQMLPKY